MSFRVPAHVGLLHCRFERCRLMTVRHIASSYSAGSCRFKRNPRVLACAAAVLTPLALRQKASFSVKKLLLALEIGGSKRCQFVLGWCAGSCRFGVLPAQILPTHAGSL